jgi:DNA uptake protein ComE-like DNA-binding protein
MTLTLRSRTAVMAGLAAVLAVSAAAQVGRNQEVLNPNRASEQELAALPQLAAGEVAAILAARPYLRMADFDAALGATLSAESRVELYAHLFVPIDLNTASREEILMVPGVGPRMAHEFEEYRPYRALAQFRREIGKYVDDDEVARLEQFVFVPIDLNSASDEDILSIPGVGQRMLHEFKEYRPYTSLAQFRREIGKYVDEGEVARLERYVTLREDG